MCVILARYFPDSGWVAAKNRDRNYTPKVTFTRKRSRNGVERLLFRDQVTHYEEGINSEGVGILSASLMVQNDEKEITKTTKEKSPDGVRIARALKETTARAAAQAARKYGLTGNSVILDTQDCFLLESCRDRRGRYRSVMREIPRDRVVARTNHGIWMPWAGYQRSDDESETLSRISSEARLLQAQYIVDHAQDPQDLIDGMCQTMVDSPQLNVMRTDTHRKKMRTTAQLMIIPSEHTLFCRPVASDIDYDFWNLNRAGGDTWVELLSNRALHQTDANGEPPFAGIKPQHQIDETLERLRTMWSSTKGSDTKPVKRSK